MTLIAILFVFGLIIFICMYNDKQDVSFNAKDAANMVTPKIIETKHDDFYYGCLAKKAGIDWYIINDVPRDSNFESIDSVYSVSNKFYINENDLCKVILDEFGMK